MEQARRGVGHETWRWSVLLVSLIACGGGQPEPSTPAAPEPTSEATPVDQPSEVEQPEPEPEPEPPAPEPDVELSLSLACGRATALVHGWTLDPDGTQPCINPGYPMDIEAVGIAGGESVHELTRGTCRVTVLAGEVEGDAEREAPRTPEGTAMSLSVQGDHCGREAAELERELQALLSMPPLTEGAEVRFDISSSAHGITGTLPAGYWVTSLGGMADLWETAYQIRGPGDASASIYTRWYFDEMDGPQSADDSFRAALLPPRPRWGNAPEPWHYETNEEELVCRRAEITPESRLRVSLYLCGSRREQRALLTAIRELHFTEARGRTY